MILLLLLIALFIVWKPLLVFFIPGILLVYSKDFRKKDILSLTTFIIAVSLGFWMTLLYFLPFLRLSLTNAFYLFSILSFVLVLYIEFKKFDLKKTKKQLPKLLPHSIQWLKNNILVLLLILFVLYIRFLPMQMQVVAAGGDMGMHTYITALIVKADSLPETYEPILDLKFNSHFFGFHTISALISLLSGIPSYRATLLMTCFTYFFITISLYVLLRNRTSVIASLITAILFTFFTRNPQFFVSWGGNPTIFSFGFAILAFASAENMLISEKIILKIVTASIYSVILLTHTVVFIQTLYFSAAIFIFYYLNKKIRLKVVFHILVISLIILSGYLFNFNFNIISEGTINFLKDAMYNPENYASFSGNITNFFITVPLYLYKHVFMDKMAFLLLFLSLLGFFEFKEKDRESAKAYVIFSIMIFVLILNTIYWILPFSYAIYPERTAIFIILPFSIFSSYYLQDFIKKVKSFARLKNLLYVILSIGLIFSISHYQWYYVTSSGILKSMVTKPDLEAMEYLKSITTEDDLIMTNYGDAGSWIPGIIMRPVTILHLPLPGINVNENREPKYAFIGNKCVYDCFLAPKNFSLIYQTENAKVYKINK